MQEVIDTKLKSNLKFLSSECDLLLSYLSYPRVQSNVVILHSLPVKYWCVIGDNPSSDTVPYLNI